MKAIPREIYGVKILYGAEVNILDLEGNIDLADEVLEKLDVVNASIHAPCYKDGDATDHTSAYLAIVNNPLVDVICHSGSPAFAYDYEKYSSLRGLYFDIRTKLQGNCITEEDLINKIKFLDKDKAVEVTRKFRNEYIEASGSASKQTLDIIWEYLNEKKY